jgi:hypothetical protein
LVSTGPPPDCSCRLLAVALVEAAERPRARSW